MEEVGAEHCDDQISQCLLEVERLSLLSLCPRHGSKHPIPEKGLAQALWKMSTWSRRRGEETCCWMTSGKSLNCISGQSCWSSRCLCPCPDLCPCLFLDPGPCPDLCPCPGPCRGCFACGCCCRGGCESGGGCDVCGGCARRIGSPGCLVGTPFLPCDPSGDGNDGNGTWRKSSCLAGDGKTTFSSQCPLNCSAPQILCHVPSLCLT